MVVRNAFMESQPRSLVARPYDEAPNGFARPIIESPEINGSLKQGKVLNPQRHVKDIVSLWSNVRREVKGQGCWLGVRADMPPRP